LQVCNPGYNAQALPPQLHSFGISFFDGSIACLGGMNGTCNLYVLCFCLDLDNGEVTEYVLRFFCTGCAGGDNGFVAMCIINYRYYIFAVPFPKEWFLLYFFQKYKN